VCRVGRANHVSHGSGGSFIDFSLLIWVLNKPKLSKREGILTLIMALAQNTKETGLGEHPSILASLIILLNVLTALLWDEDEAVMTSEALSERYDDLVMTI
jgi:hypothetical protein